MAGTSPLNDRKMQHIRACLDDSVDLQRDSFAAVKLLYNALPELSLEDVSTETDFAGEIIAAPLIISSMTGGAGDEFVSINRNLARAAQELNIPLGLGSMKVMLKHKEAELSFRVREVAPQVKLIANLGLVSFNYGLTFDDVQRIIDVVRPNAFALHLNALQEVIQVGGDTNFKGLLSRLEELVRRCPVPVVVKECGGGIAPSLVYKLAEMGVAFVDVSGNDGTSWASVEGQVGGNEMGELFKDFGLPTRWILENLDPAKLGNTKIIASGGMRDGIQATKALALGAAYVAVARPFLLAALKSAEDVIATGRRITSELQTAMFLIGAKKVQQLDRSFLM
jgi:isopentenyl-diphosphate delta-isomerase